MSTNNSTLQEPPDRQVSPLLPISFHDRADAGRQLANRLLCYREDGPIVLALPRGGVPVASEVARQLAAPLEVLPVRKLGSPGRREIGVRAMAPGGFLVLHEETIRALRIPQSKLQRVLAEEQRELQRQMGLFRGDRPLPDLHGRTVILVDDGLATGVSALVAIRALRALRPSRVVLAVPVCAPEAVEALLPQVDAPVCITCPPYFLTVGQWYDELEPVAERRCSRCCAAGTSGRALARMDRRHERGNKLAHDRTCPPQLRVRRGRGRAIGRLALALHGPADLDPLVDRIGDARYVLLGEASHGTSEYNLVRARLTQRLIREKGFSFIAVAGDSSDCCRLNQYVKGKTTVPGDAAELLRNFAHWPAWLWANWECAVLAEWP